MADSYIFDMKKFKVMITTPLGSNQVDGWASGNCFDFKMQSDSIQHDSGADGFTSIVKVNDERGMVSLKLNRGSKWNSILMASYKAWQVSNIPNLNIAVFDNNAADAFNTMMTCQFGIIVKVPDISVGNDPKSDTQWDILTVGTDSFFPTFGFVLSF